MQVGTIRALVALAWLALLPGLAGRAEARPQYLAAFEADPMRRPEAGGCGTCHVNPQGGGARNDFGTAFDGAGREITPLLRASHPQLFTFETATLPDGSRFLLSDPASKVAVFERQDQKVVVDLAALLAPKAPPIPPPENRMTFFVTSRGPADGGRMGGLAGADRFCQELAGTVGADDRTWHAYLSTTFQGRTAINAGDRIGAGPWYNAKGVLVARGPIDLHTADRVKPGVIRTEVGTLLDQGTPVFTGTQRDGEAVPGQTCDNWTATEGEAAAGDGAGPWNSGKVVGCQAPGSGPAPRVYCFAVR